MEFTYSGCKVVVIQKYHCNSIRCPRCYCDENEIGHINVLDEISVLSKYFNWEKHRLDDRPKKLKIINRSGI